MAAGDKNEKLMCRGKGKRRKLHRNEVKYLKIASCTLGKKGISKVGEGRED